MFGMLIVCCIHLAQMLRYQKTGYRFGSLAIKKVPSGCRMVQPGFAIRALMKEIKESEMRELVVSQHEMNRTGTCCFSSSFDSSSSSVGRCSEDAGSGVGKPAHAQILPPVENEKWATIIYDPRAPIIDEDEEDCGEVPWFDR